MSAAHTAVKHELLVRYLDAWTAAVLHRTKRATYVEASGGATALPVLGEYADLLSRHTLAVVLIGAAGPDLSDAPPGLEIHTAADVAELGPVMARAGADGWPVLAWLDLVPADALADAVSTVAAFRGAEILITVANGGAPAPPMPAEFPLTARVDLVDASRASERLVFGTSSLKALEKFKDELWALDEYAGIRYRDPGDAEGTLLDISLQPNLAPLRRALTRHLAGTGAVRVASLREFALRETIYRAADATRAVQALIGSGTIVRTPTAGRLSPDTVIRGAA